MKKFCKNCNTLKPISEYNKRKKSKDGHYSYCKKCKREQNKSYYQKNKEEILRKTRIYKDEHKEERIEYNRKYYAKRRKTDIDFKLKELLRGRIYKAVKNKNIIKSDRTKNLIGCNLKTLKEHLQSKFTEGMSWDNYGEWHIDHIRPCAAFDLTDPEQQKECFNYKNLQPLWAKDNLIKSSKII